MIICVLCLTIESNNKRSQVASEEEMAQEQAEDGEVLTGTQKAVLCFLAILMGMISAVLMSAKHLATKYFKGDGYTPFDQSLDAAILEGLILSFFLIPLIKFEGYTPTWVDFAWGSLAGTLIVLGRVFIAIAVAEGIAGPAQSLMSTHALHQSLWTALFAGQPLSPLQIAAVFFGLLGVFTIAAID